MSSRFSSSAREIQYSERGMEASDFVIPIGEGAEAGEEYLTSDPKEREKTRTEGP
jgi:hypothetical protein